MENLPRCNAHGTNRWGEKTYCGRPVTRVHRGLWRCTRHSEAGDPAIAPARIVEWQAYDALREAKGTLYAAEQRLKLLEGEDRAARATFIVPQLVETTDMGSGKRITKRVATVTYNGRDWTDRTVTATVTLPVGWYGNGVPGIEINPRVEYVLTNGGAAPQAMAMLWAWIAEVTDSARGDQCRDLFGAIEKATREVEEAQRLVLFGESNLTKVKEAVG